ncbi:MAG: polyphosphate kinase 1 [Deltaproteobacteria bacterium]|nr:polyphosphate kinase 1 [Deltaproteobacteria bacterium]
MEPVVAIDPGTHPEWFTNRELSWLEFNRRVLEEAQDPSNPILERVKFLAIVDSNLAEFYEVRVAGLRQQAEAGVSERNPDGLTPEEQLAAIDRAVRAMVAAQYACWSDEILPALEKEGCRIQRPDALSKKDATWLEEHFETEIFPVLTPIAVDPAHPFPHIQSKSISIAALLGTEDAQEPYRLGVVQAPRVLSRIIRLPDRPGHRVYVFLPDVLRWQLPRLFPGVPILDHTAFRVTRNSNLYVDEEEIENLLTAVEQELRRRRRGEAVRLEVREPAGPQIEHALLGVFELERSDLFECHGPVNLSRLHELVALEERERPKAQAFVAPVHVALRDPETFLRAIRRSDLLLHHPFDSFSSVSDFVDIAARDPQVLAIKQTLYRTSEDSPIARSLLAAAEKGKQVTVVVELMARFDEEANIRWARRMEEAGVQIVYGLVGLKTHCKLLLVVRREEGGIRRYAHIGTGNYNHATARIYTDLALLTADPDVTAEVAAVFNMLTSLSAPGEFENLLVAPFTVRSGVLERIEREILHARAGRRASIVAKMNALQDEEIIRALYRASQAGVSIDLVVRGICCLRPGITGVSENIRVRSIVDRFLEHSRILRFENGGDPEYWIGSADWMPRNLDRRVEVMCRVRASVLRERLDGILDLYLRDDVKAREVLPDGSHRRVPRVHGLRVQDALVRQHLAAVAPSFELPPSGVSQ